MSEHAGGEVSEDVSEDVSEQVTEQASDSTSEPAHAAVDGCDLCEAARITPWFHEDDVCWIAECEICAVPMVVWRRHGTRPSPAELDHMHLHLARIAGETLTVEHYVDDNMRNIPDHYHAHARPRGGFFGHGFRR